MSKKNINAFIFARLDSSRFPRKNLSKIKNHSLLSILFNRAKLCNFDECFLLTTERSVDDDLCNHANEIGLRYIRGDSFDLTKRTKKAIHETNTDYFARLNCDSPFLDSTLINFAIENMGTSIFVSNIFERTFPYGISVEIAQSDFYLETISKKINDEYLEHVTKHIYGGDETDMFLSIKQMQNQSDLQLVIDEREHLDTIKNLTEGFDLVNSHYWEILNIEKPRFILETVS